MDRHVEFVTQLSRLVVLYALEPIDRAAEKAALRAARAAAKHGAVSLAFDEGVLRAGTHALRDDEVAQLSMLRDSLLTAGINSVDVAHHATQAEVKALARLLARVSKGELAGEAFAEALHAQSWDDMRVELAAPVVAVPDEGAAAVEDLAPPAADTPVAMPSDAPSTAEAPEAEAAPVEPEAVVAPAPDAGPLASALPPSAAALATAAHRQLFERLITSSEPSTLRLFIDPVQLAVEKSMREGDAAEALQLLIVLLDCEELADDAEMRRQFVVTLRRLTKPTLLRGFAALYTDKPSLADGVERVMRRFGEDGAEAVIDQIACASTSKARAAYTELLRRMPTARDAVVEMVDDDHAFVVERGVELAAMLKFSDAERVLGEQLSHPAARVRRAAARGLAEFQGSAFALDALMRALQDSAVDVRFAAAVALQARRDPRLAASLVQRFDEEPELEVQLALIVALGRIAALEGVQKLVALSSADSRQQRKRDGMLLRLAAIEALGEARTPQAMVTLQKLLEDREKEVREMAARLYTRARRQTTGSIAVVPEP